MFELDDYSGAGIHDGLLNKYADTSCPTLDFYISDSLQDMIDLDIRSEIAHVVNSASEYGGGCIDDLASLDYTVDGMSPLSYSSVGSGDNTSPKETLVDIGSGSNSCLTEISTGYGLASSNSSSLWFGSSSDIFSDVGACVNPISVMPLISSSMMRMSPKINLNAHTLHTSTTPQQSPNVNDIKSHLTFSPAHIKISGNIIRKEHNTSLNTTKHFTGESRTTCDITTSTNTILRQKNGPSVDMVKKSLDIELSKPSSLSNSLIENIDSDCSRLPVASTIKLGSGIGSLTFANNTNYNKLKQQSSVSTSQNTTIPNSANFSLRSHNIDQSTVTVFGIGNVTKILPRNVMQTSSGLTPKSIASSAHCNYIQQQSLQLQQLKHQQQQQINVSNMNEGTVPTILTASSIGILNGIDKLTYTTTINGGGINNNTYAATDLSSTSTSNLMSLTNTPQRMVAAKGSHHIIKVMSIASEYPKPTYSYSCLIALALKNSRRGSLPVSEIYSFMCEHFPYFKTAPSGWKNSVRHNLSLNKCFEKIEKPPTNGNQRKGCLWAMNPNRISKMDEEMQKWSRKDPIAIRNAMACPDNLEALERGEIKHGSSGDSDIELDSQSEIEETSDFEEQEIDDSLMMDNLLVEEDIDDDEILTTPNTLKSNVTTNGVTAMLNATSLHGNNIVVLNSRNEIVMQQNSLNVGNRVMNKNNTNAVNTVGGTMSTTILDPTMGTTLTVKAITNNNKRIHLTSSPTATLNFQSQDFEDEMEDTYDSISMEDDDADNNNNKETECMNICSTQNGYIEISPADYNTNIECADEEGPRSPKRARLNINYAINASNINTNSTLTATPIANIKTTISNSGVQSYLKSKQRLNQQEGQQTGNIQIQNIKKFVKVQNIHQLQELQYQIQQQQQPHKQHIVYQTIVASQQQKQESQQQQQNQLTTVVSGSAPSFVANVANRRKMQIVNRVIEP